MMTPAVVLVINAGSSSVNCSYNPEPFQTLTPKPNDSTKSCCQPDSAAIG